MKLRHHVIITTSITLLLFILALVVALFGMQTTKNRFQQFIEVDQALLNEETTMYAQGLQMGQALRNIVMEPSDQVAYRNLDNAAQIFENALEQARQIAHADPKSLQRLAAIASIRQRHIEEQERVKSILQNQPAAIRAVRENETPVWREMRALLIESINEHRENVAVMGQEMQALSQTILSLSLLLGVIGLIVSAGLMTWLAQHILRLIGGDPAEALQVTSAIAKGDFTQTITLRPGDQNSLLAAMNTMQNNLIDMASRMQQTAESIDTAAHEISLGNVDLSARTESQAAGLEETAAAMEELTSTVRLNADNAHEANRLAAQAADKATQGGQAVAQA
ncbi:MAG: chemotaxis protein, partial [Alcaligenaceae bacterium]|nr:chemotaxis protein [Alcaligenaceae bacterium]